MSVVLMLGLGLGNPSSTPNSDSPRVAILREAVQRAEGFAFVCLGIDPTDTRGTQSLKAVRFGSEDPPQEMLMSLRDLGLEVVPRSHCVKPVDYDDTPRLKVGEKPGGLLVETSTLQWVSDRVVQLYTLSWSGGMTHSAELWRAERLADGGWRVSSPTIVLQE